MQKILIIGGSRFVGPYLIKELLLKGDVITVFNRGIINTKYPAEVNFIMGDRNVGFNINKHFDVVIDMSAYNGKQTEMALKELNFDFFVHFGTAAAYKKTEIFPLREDSPLGDWPLWGKYNKGKAECEQILEKNRVSYASLRPVYILGPNNYLPRESFIYSRIKSNSPIVLPGNGQTAVQFISVRDVAKSLAILAETRIAGAFNCAGDEIITLKGLVEEMAHIVGNKPVIQYNAYADGEKFNDQEFPFANENFICSNEKIKNTGIAFAPLKEFLKKDYESYYKNIT